MDERRSADFGQRGGARTTQRRGRMTPAKRTALAELGPAWFLDPATAASATDLDAAFGRAAPRLLDIGVGTGEATLAWALAHPDHDVVAVELHRPGMVRLATALETGGPATVRVVEADVLALLDASAPDTWAQVRVLFPDPWPKRRHVGRRLVDVAFVGRVADLLPPGGTLHLATDWDDYAQQMRAALATEPRLAPVADVVDPDPPAGPDDRHDRHDGPAARGGPGVLPALQPPRWRTHRPDRPVTAYEQRGLDAGRPIADLVARRT